MKYNPLNRLYLYITAIVCWFLCGSLWLKANPFVGSEPNPDFHVFILLGQSNMEGANSVDGEMDKETDPRIYKMNALGNWVLASDPITNNADVAIGPGFQFAKKMLEENPDISIGLISLAEGGKELQYWNNIYGTPYRDVIYFANEARKKGVLKGILWHQGESDTGDTGKAYNYGLNLMRLIDHIRVSLHDPYLPFIAGELTEARHPETEDWLELRPVINDELRKVSRDFFQTGFVSSKDVPYQKSDAVHFTSQGQRMMGERYANEYLRVSGFWTEKGKNWLDSTITDEADGWKFHPDLGAYYDEYWPIIKHAQLGWGELEIDQNHSMTFKSPFLGSFQILQNDQNEQIINITKVTNDTSGDPSYSPPYAVFIHHDLGSPYVFYDYQSKSYMDRIPGMALIEKTEDLNSLMEAEFLKTQETAQELRVEIAYSGRFWSMMRKWVDQTVYYRNFTNLIGWEGYLYAAENESGNSKNAWLNHFVKKLREIDEITGQAQAEYQAGENQILSGR